MRRSGFVKMITTLLSIVALGGGALAQSAPAAAPVPAPVPVPVPDPSAPVQVEPVDPLAAPFNALHSVARPGQPTQAEGGPAAPGALGSRPDGPGSAARTLQPFGASLFTGQASAAPGPDVNSPNYHLQPGDRVSLRLYGATNLETVLTIDVRGNAYIPEAGLVHLEGVAAADLQATVQREVRVAYADDVKVYAVLATPQRIGVYVTGAVLKPGRYIGAGSDTVIDYLVRAGGIDNTRGSFRDITIVRAGQVVGQVDLYPFLIGGLMTAPDLREGDSIVVGQQKALVAVDGAVRNNYLFELPTPARGKALMALAHPLPAATHVSIRGSRDNRPFSQYIDLAAFTDFAVQDQDQITFVADARTPFIRVRVQGSRQAPSVLTVKDTTTLPELLATLQIDPDQADVSNVYILRRTVFEQQTRIMNDAMDRLERNLFLSSAPTANIAQIQSSEANLAATYLHRARQTTADGRLVVVDDQGRPANIRLEDEDIVVIPKRSQTVLVGGEVMTPQIVVYDPRLTRADYIARAGGLAEHGKGGRCIIRRASGLVTEKDAPIRPGDEIIVLPTIGHHNIQLSIDIVDIAYQMAVVANVLK